MERCGFSSSGSEYGPVAVLKTVYRKNESYEIRVCVMLIKQELYIRAPALKINY